MKNLFLALFRRSRRDRDMAAEMRTHIEEQTQRNLAAGMSPDHARAAAHRQFGGVAQIQERGRDARGLRWLADFLQDLGYGVRHLRKHPGFTAVAVLTLALGIGVNSTIVSFIDDMILHPMLRDQQKNLVALHTARAGADRDFRSFNHAEFTLLKDEHAVFSDVAAMQFNSSAVGSGEDVQRRLLCLVSQNYFSVLGVAPLRGRFFSAEEARPNAAIPVAVANYVFWQRMGGREDFVGSQIQINGRNYTVIGIAPEGFGGLQWSIGPYAWLPLGMSSSLVGGWGGSAAKDLLDAHSYWLELFGNLRPGLTPAAANRALAPLAARLNEQAAAGASEARELSVTPPSRYNLSISQPPHNEDVVGIYAIAALGTTVSVLLVACLNVANMLYSRGVSRQKEIAIRLSLGASRARVVRQLLVEGLLLALAGGTSALLLSRWVNHAMLLRAGEAGGSFALHLRTTFDWPLLGATFALCLLATLVFSLAPALRATRLNLVEDLKQQTGEPAGAGRWSRLFSFRHCVVMTQIALSLMLVFGTGLMLQAVLDMEKDRGFETRGEIIANLDYFLAGLSPQEMLVRQKALLARTGALSGVAGAAVASAVPFNNESNWRPVFPVGAAASADDAHGDQGHPGIYTVVSHGYFAVLDIPLLHGRDFTEAEALQGDGPPVAIIDESLGRTLFGDQDPVGRHIAMRKAEADGQHAGREIEIVGLVQSPREDAFQSARPLPRIYRPLAQSGTANTFLHVKLTQPSALPAMLSTLRRELRALDPGTPLLVCEPLTGFIGSNLNVWSVRFLATTFTLFGLIAVVLAVVGVYSVKAYIVARRTREIGIRIAIGARPADVLTLILRQAMLQTAVGLAAGLVLAALTGQFLSTLLYRVNPVDPLLLVIAAALIALASILACLIPALRATKINPTVALRAE